MHDKLAIPRDAKAGEYKARLRFSSFNFTWIVWGGLVPLILAVGSVPQPARAFQLGGVAALQENKDVSAQEVSRELERAGLGGRFPLMQEAVRRHVKLLVLPETIAGGTTRLDHTVSRQEPLSNQTS